MEGFKSEIFQGKLSVSRTDIGSEVIQIESLAVNQGERRYLHQESIGIHFESVDPQVYIVDFVLRVSFLPVTVNEFRIFEPEGVACEFPFVL